MRFVMFWRGAVEACLIILIAYLLLTLAMIVVTVLFAGCTYNVTLTVNLPGDPAPTVNLEPQPQTKPDTNL